MKFKVSIADRELYTAEPAALRVLPILERAMWASVGQYPERLVLSASDDWNEALRPGGRVLHGAEGYVLGAERDHVRRAISVEGILPDTAEAKGLVTVLGALAQGHDIAAVFTAMRGPQASNPAGTR